MANIICHAPKCPSKTRIIYFDYIDDTLGKLKSFRTDSTSKVSIMSPFLRFCCENEDKNIPRKMFRVFSIRNSFTEYRCLQWLLCELFIWLCYRQTQRGQSNFNTYRCQCNGNQMLILIHRINKNISNNRYQTSVRPAHLFMTGPLQT